MNAAGLCAVVPVKEGRRKPSNASPACGPSRAPATGARDARGCSGGAQPPGRRDPGGDGRPGRQRCADGYGARVSTRARDGHTGAVARRAWPARRRTADMLTIPADIPLVHPTDIREAAGGPWQRPGVHDRAVARRAGLERDLLLAGRRGAFAVWRQQFLSASRGRAGIGITPHVVRLPRIALDIDHPEDLVAFTRIPSQTRSRGCSTRWHGRKDCCGRGTIRMSARTATVRAGRWRSPTATTSTPC